MIKTVLKPFRNFATFKGCSGRKEYWSFMLLIFLPCMFVGHQLDPRIYGLFTYIFFLPVNALCTRRFHDIGLSGYFYLALTLLPFVIFITCGFIDDYFGITTLFNYRISWFSAWLFVISLAVMLLMCCFKSKNTKFDV
jgi:uncharacterized membrane protein YhaH (DUF805 family)